MDKIFKERMKELSRGNKKKSKNENSYVSQKTWYDITLTNLQFHLYEEICMINGINPKIYMYSDRNETILFKNIKINDEFKELSKLDWDTPKDINSLTFRGRFATILLLKIARNSHKIVKKLYDNIKSDKKRYESYNMILDDWISRIDMFLVTYLSSNTSYVEHLQSILEILILAEDDDAEIIRRLADTRDFLIKSCKRPGNYDSGIICNNIIKLAFVLSTDSMKVKKTPEYHQNIQIDDYYDIRDQVGGLGSAILIRRKKDDEIPLLYNVFQKALPEMISKFDDCDEYPELIVGIKALTFLKIFIDDRSVSKYIDKMLIM